MSQELSSLIGQILMRSVRDFEQRVDEDLRQRGIHGISNRHRSVFLHLAQLGPCRAVELAAAAGVRPQSMMKTLHELEDRGLVQRHEDPDDSRAKQVDFTDAGRALIDEFRRSTDTVWQQYAALIGTEQLTTIALGLQELLRHAQPGVDEHAPS